MNMSLFRVTRSSLRRCRWVEPTKHFYGKQSKDVETRSHSVLVVREESISSSDGPSD